MNKPQNSQTIRIGGATASFSDTALSVPQLLDGGRLDYLVFDYLAEGSMGIFGRMQAQDPSLGYGTDFLTIHLGPYLGQIAEQGVRVVANAGGVNPKGLAAALEAQIKAEGLDLTVACIDGDDLRDQLEMLRDQKVDDMFTGAAFPEAVISANAYFGAFPIAEALRDGADIIITGRVVDSAVVLGPLICEFGWSATDYDLLAAGTLAGHLLECGAQLSGATFTDWQDVPDWANMGYPIGECHPDGTFVLSKVEGTGGLISVGTVSEQLLYEVSDPADYIVADVRCDFSSVVLRQEGADRVHVSGARGSAPTTYYKACVTFDEGWRAVAFQPIIGEDAEAKAERQAEALFARGEMLLARHGLPPFTRTELVLIGAENSFGPHRLQPRSREIIAKLVVDHPDKAAADLFAREQWMAIQGMSVGTSVNLATTVLPATGVFLCLVDKAVATPRITIRGKTKLRPDYRGESKPLRSASVEGAGRHEAKAVSNLPDRQDGKADTAVDLIRLAWLRSGDKGHLFNVAVIARQPDFLPWIARALSAEAVAKWYGHLGMDDAPVDVTRFEVPGIYALNFVVNDALPGGINASVRLDPAAKGMGQMLARFQVMVPQQLADSLTVSSEQNGEQ